MKYYHSEFKKWAKEIILEENLQDLSSDGWKRINQIERELVSKQIELEVAIEKFLDERDYKEVLEKKYGHKLDEYLEKKLEK